MSQPEVATLPTPDRLEGDRALAKRFSDIITGPELAELELEMLYAELLEVRQGEALIAEVHTLLGIYNNRAVTYFDEEGHTILQFATRNNVDPQNPWLDDIYTISEDSGGHLTYEAQIMQARNVGLEFSIRPETAVDVRVINGGSYAIHIRSGSESEADALEEIVHTSMKTARIVYERQEADPEGAAQADEQAQAMLLAMVRKVYSDARAT